MARRFAYVQFTSEALRDNLVLLTLKEHHLIHLLLWKQGFDNQIFSVNASSTTASTFADCTASASPAGSNSCAAPLLCRVPTTHGPIRAPYIWRLSVSNRLEAVLEPS